MLCQGILVVEDDDENLNRGITFTEKSGYEVFQPESVKKRKELQVIIMWMLPFVM